MSLLKELQSVAKSFSILYVEDNKALRDKATVFLKKFFKNVDVGVDGADGLSLFKNKRHPIVITDIKMPKMDGMSMISHIQKIDSDVKSIVMSAFDDKELLLQGIEYGVFRFLKKPVNVNMLTDILYQAVTQIKNDNNKKLFYTHLKSVFNYQSSMVCMIKGNKIALANEMFLSFFEYESIEECKNKTEDISLFFLEHDGFLYNSQTANALEDLKSNPNKLFHVKLKTPDGLIKHFILKYHLIPEKENYGVLSFDDVTELNLMNLFDTKQSNYDAAHIKEEELFNLLEIVQRNSAKIELHNYYKGLSITNYGVISEIKDGTIEIKSTYMQLKAAQMEKKLLIVSTAFPSVLQANKIDVINFEKQTIICSDLHFTDSSPITRKTIRVTIESKQSISLFVEGNKYHGDIDIIDISLDALKVKLNALPAGLDMNSAIRLDMVLELDNKPLIINTQAKLYKKSESRHSFTLVLMFEALKKSSLVKYITKRQMELIREIKGMQNG